MAITRLQNIFTSKTGRILYVSPDDFDASDLISNRGNSPLRPFKTLQRALLEVAKFSYVPGDSGQNDRFDQFTIMLYPGEHIVDNRPGLSSNSVPQLTDNSNFNIQDPNNDLYKFNSVLGGVIIPRGASIVGMDLRKTKIIPKFIPDPSTTNSNKLKSNYPTTGIINSGSVVIDDDTRSSIFRITGSCYFWQFSIFDGDASVYKANPSINLDSSINWTNSIVSGDAALFSRHKLTAFEYACKADLNLYYQKITTTFNIPSSDPIAQRSEETKIVGPGGQSADVVKVGLLSYTGTGNNIVATARTIQTTNNNPRAHEFSVGNRVNIFSDNANISPYSGGPYKIIAVSSSAGSGTTLDEFSYIIPSQPLGSISGTGTTQIYSKLETDTVDSASPYIFNISLRSTYGMCGMHANGAFADGFKSMVVAQFTGISLQRDENAFVRYCSTGGWSTGNTCDNVTYSLRSYEDINSKYRKGWSNYHIKASNDGYIQIVSCFAIGYSNQFVVESGADMSIANSNSSFGANSLVSKGFRSTAFTKDSYGKITHIIPPKSLSNISTEKLSYLPLDRAKIAASGDKTKLYLFGYTSQSLKPPKKILEYTIGGKTNDLFSVDFDNSGTVVTKTDAIQGAGPAVKNISVGEVGSPLQWDSSVSNWYLKVTGTNIGGYITGSGASPIGYIQRKPDNRVLSDKIYRLRYEIPSTALQAGIPQTGFTIQPLGSGIGSTNNYNRVFYIFDIEEYQKYISGVQTGIYYLTVLLGDITPTDTNFNDRKFSQNINDLYPIIDIDSVIDDPAAAVSSADNLTIGLVNTDDKSKSITKEFINVFKTSVGISVDTIATLGSTEDRKISVGTSIEVELRRPSTIRAGNQTFEYTGYGPGNYSTAFPSKQTKILSESEILLSQSLQESGGVSFYSGLNSNGDLYIGNVVVDPVTGTSRTINNPTASVDENNPIYNGLTIKNTINVVGGPENSSTSIFSGPVSVNKQLSLTGNLEINSKYLSIDPFTGIKLNANSNSAPSGTKIFDIQVDNSTKFSVDRDGNVVLNGSLLGSGVLSAARNSITLQIAQAGTGFTYNNSTGVFTYGQPTLNDVVNANSVTTSSIWINNNTSSSSTITGALKVTGGIGVGGNINIGGSLSATSASFSGTNTTNLTVGSGLTAGTANITGNLKADSININTTGIEQGDLGSNGGSDGIFGIYNTSTSGSITFNTENQSGTSQSRLTINSTSITAGSGVSFVGNGTIPIGGIIMWSGTIVNIPTNWALCNGQNGTPDLRNRFIVGASVENGSGNYTWNADTGATSGNYGVGNTGGEAAHQLTVNEMPSHTHTMNYQQKAVEDTGTASVSDLRSAGGDNDGGSTDYTNQTGNINNTGGDKYHENRPPYYALAFIMRTA